ncbi:hypothetical protein RYX56_00200 [Alkalihalophilus lindianensis]|uniref:Uncharacterized protein n=1 Tax=Alkalihalophilus lindianensis TaxID=1630542 RepID=A0ABU3X4G8_9BACI|nr:hypothetical protein [Alkalihalophilus lindianensis]MDV2682785.1 hypothetical protein [Alkalihalophilus lindianensis]
MDLLFELMDYFFMLIILSLSVYNIYIKGNDERIWAKVGEEQVESIKSSIQFLCFGGINSFFGGYIFGLEWLYWITFYSVLVMIICFESIHRKRSTRIGMVVVVIAIFMILRVPNHPGSFEDHINSMEGYQCLYGLECVKIGTSDTEDDTFEIVTNVFMVQRNSYDWYILFAKAAITLEDDEGNVEEIRGLNIAGFWNDY